MVVIFLVQEFAGGNGLAPRWYEPLMAVPAESLAAWAQVRHGAGGLAEWAELGTWLSCVFLHADISHLAYNMLALWLFAALAADLLGQRWMLLLFFATALGGSVCHVLLNAESMVPCLGASGAVMGFEGAYLGLATRYHLPEPQVWPMSRPIPPAQFGAFGGFRDPDGLHRADGPGWHADRLRRAHRRIHHRAVSHRAAGTHAAGRPGEVTGAVIAA